MLGSEHGEYQASMDGNEDDSDEWQHTSGQNCQQCLKKNGQMLRVSMNSLENID